uniref:Venom protein n=1 Tax=Ampulex compressa TaxID=860918 RepID=A0A1W6EWB0_AMPCP|nr:venom protein [Ampulex compressa]
MEFRGSRISTESKSKIMGAFALLFGSMMFIAIIAVSWVEAAAIPDHTYQPTSTLPPDNNIPWRSMFHQFPSMAF